MAPEEVAAVAAKGEVFVELKMTVSLNIGYNGPLVEVMTSLNNLMCTIAGTDSVRDRVLTYHVERIIHRPQS